MGKHSMEKKNKEINKKSLIIMCIIIILIIVSILVTQNKDMFKIQKNESVNNWKTVEGEKLVLKSKLDYNRIIEYSFENNILKTIKIYEQYEDDEEYEEKKKTYNLIEDINLLKVDDKNLSIEIENKKLGEDEGLSYEEIYDKYLNQLIDVYIIIE